MYLENLGGNDGEDLDLDPVELIEAGPGATAGEASEEFAHGFNLQLV